MGAVFAQPCARGAVAATPGPRAALVAPGGAPLESLGSPATLCLGSERDGLPEEVVAECGTRVSIRRRPGAESLNVAAAAAIAMQRISSPGSENMDVMGNGDG
jgi:tRNA C32,U32 (ribose-2'-O)-methylase TrmJ